MPTATLTATQKQDVVNRYRPKTHIEIKPQDRWAILGKTGSGKSQFTVTLVTLIAAEVNKDPKGDLWQVWWCDTKGVAEDISRLRKWGYVRVKSLRGGNPDGPAIYRYFRLEPVNPDAENCYEEVAQVARAAYKHERVIFVVDEYVQAVLSTRRMGRPLQDLAQRGRGHFVGFIGETQEPVDIPRQLVSQATHVCIFDLSYERDIEWVRQFFPQYVLPSRLGYPHGFWYRHVDGQSQMWLFFKHEREFYEWIRGEITT